METSRETVDRCRAPTPWGACRQLTRGLCTFHQLLASGGRVDTYYHRKVATGLTQIVDQYATPAQLRQLEEGRLHYDGRQLDAWVPE